MGGGLIQLISYGAEDIYLTGNPQITLFKMSYRKYVNFAIEGMELAFRGDTSYGKTCNVTIDKKGDLITKMYVKVTPTSTWNNYGSTYWGNNLIKQVELRIGGYVIDKQYGHWLDIWNNLTCSTNKLDGLSKMIKPVSGEDNILFIPLKFFCCRHNGLAIPLVALYYEDVNINIVFANSSDIGSVTNDFTATLLVDYVYLDEDERKKYAESTHEYLVEQLQVMDNESGEIKLNFSYPVKELIWTTRNSGVYNLGTENSLEGGYTSVSLFFNGKRRFSLQPSNYFSNVQGYQHHKNSNSKINIYSFSLNPEILQPSGTCNFSRLKTIEMTLNNLNSSKLICIYAVNYNVLRIMCGMARLVYGS